jgi:hypothetical protein
MPWISVNQYERATFENTVKEIEEGSERASAIVAGAFVDEHLTHAIKARLASNDGIIKEMFRSSGPLGSFSSRIHLGFLLHLYSEPAWKELDTIKKIRNEFAHRLDTRSFAVERVRDLANNLKLSDTAEFHIATIKSATGTETKFEILLGEKPGNRASVPLIEPTANPTPRERYIRACKLFIGVFSLAHNFKSGKALL